MILKHLSRFLLALTLTMRESFETSDYRSEHFTTVPFLSKINKRPIVSYKLCVSSRVKGFVILTVWTITILQQKRYYRKNIPQYTDKPCSWLALDVDRLLEKEQKKKIRANVGIHGNRGRASQCSKNLPKWNLQKFHKQEPDWRTTACIHTLCKYTTHDIANHSSEKSYGNNIENRITSTKKSAEKCRKPHIMAILITSSPWYIVMALTTSHLRLRLSTHGLFLDVFFWKIWIRSVF